MGFKHRVYLGGSKIYACAVCKTHLATIETMMSRRFNGQHGQAFLFESVSNVVEAEAEDRQMTTGLHRVRDIQCAKCGTTMGWKYEKAYEPSQKYKEGKAILEKALLVECTPPAFALPSSSGIQEDGSSGQVSQVINVNLATPLRGQASTQSMGIARSADSGTAVSVSPYTGRAVSSGSEESE